MRAFIAVEVPEKLRQEVSALFASLRRGLPVRWVAPGNMHLTLKFLGETDAHRQEQLAGLLEEVAGRTPVFPVRLEGVGGFPNLRAPRVIWVGVSTGSRQLTDLAGAIEAGCVRLGFPREARFHPHLTVGRVKEPVSAEFLSDIKYTSDEFAVSSVILFKSTLTPAGPIYEPLRTFPFAS